MDENDQMLIKRIKAREPVALNTVLHKFGSSTFALIANMVKCQEDAEEVYQDVFLKVFDKIDTYDGNKAELSSWIKRIAYNESLNFMRKRKLPIEYANDNEVDLSAVSDEDVDELLQTNDEANISLIEKSLDMLPPDEHALILMFYYEDMPIKDIAFITNSIPTTVASRLCRIRRKLYIIIKGIKK